LVTVPLVIPDEGLFLEPGFFYLGVTREWVQTKDVVPCIEGVSTAARYGLSVHQTAGFGDAGFMGHFTMEITSCLKLRIYAGMRIAQLYFTSLEFSNGKSRYSGHYGNHYEEDPFPRKPVPGNLTRHLRS
jgi:dCTP deaminase